MPSNRRGTPVPDAPCLVAYTQRRAPPGFAGLVVGLTVAGIITTTGNIAGSSLNPTRTFDPYLGDWLLGGTNFWEFFPIYIIGPIVGAVLAAFLYDYVSGG